MTNGRGVKRNHKGEGKTTRGMQLSISVASSGDTNGREGEKIVREKEWE